MAFTDLPLDIRDRPLTDARLVADVLDLVVMESDRRRGALAVLLCDEHDRLRIPVVVDEPDDDASADKREQVLSVIGSSMEGTGSMLVALARAQGLSVREGDRAWARAAVRACADGPRLLGVHVITLDGSRQVPLGPVESS